MTLNNSKHLLGHTLIEGRLAKAIRNDRVFPTWIFEGPRGIGKSHLAYKFATCLLSETMPTDDTLSIPPDLPVNRLVTMRSHPDFFVLDHSEDNRSIDDIRELLSKLRLTPSLSKWRVAILEDADSFNKNIYNSLLKFLEEPPKNTVVILICNSTGLMPKTLLSRAFKIQFNTLSEAQVTQVLMDRDIPNAAELAHISDGSIGFALHLHANNGLEIYNRVLQGFSSQEHSKKTLQYLIDKKLANDFKTVKHCFIKILKSYVEIMNDLPTSSNSPERDVFHNLPVDNCDQATRNSMEIISMLNKCEPYMLDKNAVFVYAYDKFFN